MTTNFIGVPCRALSRQDSPKAIIRAACAVVLLAGVCAGDASAQVTQLLRGDGDDPLPTSVYVGDENDIYIIPGSSGSQVVSTITWSAVTTAPSGATNTYNYGQQSNLHLTLGQLGSITISAKFTYMQTPGGPLPPSNTVTATITVTPPTSATFDAVDSPPSTKAYNFGTGDYFYFHIVGGSWNNGFNMIVEEKISITVPSGTAPPFGGGWGWNTGNPANPNNAPYINMDTTGLIKDLKICNNNDPAIGVGQPVYQYSQTIGVRVQNMDGTITDITLKTFTVKHIRLPESELNVRTCRFPGTQTCSDRELLL